MNSPGEINFLMQQGKYQDTVNISFKDKKMKRLNLWIERNLSKILFYSLILSLLGYFYRYI